MDYRYSGLGVGSVPPQLLPPGPGAMGAPPLGDPSQAAAGTGAAMPPGTPSSLLAAHPSLMFHYGK